MDGRLPSSSPPFLAFYSYFFFPPPPFLFVVVELDHVFSLHFFPFAVHRFGETAVLGRNLERVCFSFFFPSGATSSLALEDLVDPSYVPSPPSLTLDLTRTRRDFRGFASYSLSSSFFRVSANRTMSFFFRFPFFSFFCLGVLPIFYLLFIPSVSAILFPDGSPSPFMSDVFLSYPSEFEVPDFSCLS